MVIFFWKPGGPLMLIDTHSHLHHSSLNKERKGILTQMCKKNITFVEVPIDFDSNFVMREKLKNIPNVRFAAGIHPTRVWKTKGSPELILRHIIRFARRENTVAIGEVGLDYHIGTEESWSDQEKWFHHFIEIAQQEDLPMILHIRQAYEDAIRVLKEHGDHHRGVVHCFQGDWEVAKQYIDLGLFLGIGGFITKGCPDLEDTVKKMPLDVMVLETDCPFITPEPLSGRNSPLNIPLIAQKIADIKGISVEKVEEVTTQNAIRLFGLDK